MEKSSQLSAYSLEKSDHVWIWDDFQKTTPRAADDNVVREILSHYLPQQNFHISHSKNGQPELITDDNKKIFITLSHSKKCLVLGLSKKNELGIDVEQIKQRKNLAKLANRYFLDSQHDNSLEAFYRSWTAREAFIKAIGGRLFEHLAKIHLVATDPIAIGLNGKLTHQVITRQLGSDYALALCRQATATTPVEFFTSSPR